MKHFSLLFLLTCLTACANSLPAIRLPQDIIDRLGLTFTRVGPQVVGDPVIATAQTIIDPARTHSVATFFAGQIDRDSVQLGDIVKPQQELTRLRSREVAEVIAAFLEASSKLETASLLYKRERELRLKNLTTEEALINAKAAYREALATRTATRQTALLVRSQGDLLSMLEGDGTNDYTQLPILSPVAGVVIEKTAYAGDPVASDHPLFEIADLSKLLVEIQLPLQAATMVKVGDPLSFQTIVGAPRVGEVQITMMSSVINANSLTLRVLGVLENGANTWRAGTPLRVKVTDSTAPTVTAAPANAVVLIDGQPHLFTVGEGNLFQPIAITTGQKSQDFIEITGGLARDTRVVMKGASLLLAAWAERASE